MRPRILLSIFVLCMSLCGCGPLLSVHKATSVKPVPAQVQKSYSAKGTVVGVQMVPKLGLNPDSGREDWITVQEIDFQTPSGTLFLIPFKQNEVVLFKQHSEGFLKYHDCGGGLHCFDSFTPSK